MRSAWDVQRSVKRYLTQALGSTWEVRIEDEQGAVTFPYARVRRVGPLLYGGNWADVDTTATFSLALYAGPKDTAELAAEAAAAIEESLFRAFRVGGGTIEPPASLTATAGTQGTLAAGTYRYVVTAAPRQGETLPSPAASASTIGTTGSVALAWAREPSARSYRVYRGAAGAERLLARVHSNLTGYTDTGAITPHPSKAPPVTNTSVSTGPMRIPLYDYDGLTVDDPAADATARLMPADFVRVQDFNSTQMPEPEDNRRIAVTATLRVSWRRWGERIPEGPTATDVRTRVDTSLEVRTQ